MSPGKAETRAKLLTCGFMSYYDVAFHMLAPGRAANERNALHLSASGQWQGPGSKGTRATALQDLTRRRRGHTLAAINATEAQLMNAAIADFLRAFSSPGTDSTFGCTGVNWPDLSQVISVRYSIPLRQLWHALGSPPLPSANSTIAREFLVQARYKSHALLMPFMQYPSSTVIHSTIDGSEWTLESKTDQETFSRDGIGRQEKVIVEVAEDVLAAICGVIIQIGFQIQYEWLSHWNTPKATAKQLLLSSITDQAFSWKREIEELMAWLGWAADEVRCEKLCLTDEYCYIPMWPLNFVGNKRPPRRPPYTPGNHIRPGPPDDGRPPYPYRYSPPGPGLPPAFPELEEDLWSPRCIKIRV